MRVIEAHNGLTGLIAEEAEATTDEATFEFDSIWISSLTDSTAKGKPDIELVDFTSRVRTIENVLEVTTKPIIVDCDSGGRPEHFVYTVRTLERLGVSAAVIEDKVGLKKNSLYGTEVPQTKQRSMTSVIRFVRQKRSSSPNTSGSSHASRASFSIKGSTMRSAAHTPTWKPVQTPF